MDNLSFYFMGTSVSLVESIGAVVGIVYLILEYRANRWLWLFGALMPLFYIFIFLQQKLYANMALNVYYLGASVYGAWCWWGRRETTDDATPVDNTPVAMPGRLWWVLAAVATGLTLLITVVLHLLGESHMAWLDGLTAALSIVGMWMMAKKYYQQWLCWIVVEPIMLLLSLLSDLYPTALMYVVYCVIAVLGYRRWRQLALQAQPAPVDKHESKPAQP